MDEEGNISTYLNDVLSKWGSEFKRLFSFEPEDSEFDDNFYSHIINWLERLQQTCLTLDGLNHDSLESEVE